jgi:hypothetical protein
MLVVAPRSLAITGRLVARARDRMRQEMLAWFARRLKRDGPK